MEHDYIQPQQTQEGRVCVKLTENIPVKLLLA